MDGVQGPGRTLPPVAVNPSGQATHGGVSMPATAVRPVSPQAAKIRAYFDAAAKQRGMPYIPHGDPAALLGWEIYYHLTPEQAQHAVDTIAQQLAAGKTEFSDEEIDNIGFAARGGRDAPDQYDPAYDVGSSARQAVDAAGKTQSWSGADDPRLLGIIQQAAGTAGATLTPEQARQLAQAGYGYTHATGQAGNADTDSYLDWLAGQATHRKLLEGHQMNPATWDSLGDTGRALYLSAVGRSGRDQTEWQQKLNASRPVGTARPSQGVDYAQNLAGVY